MIAISSYNLVSVSLNHLSEESLCVQCVCCSVDGAQAVFHRRGNGFAGAARETARGLSGPRARLLSATQVPDPEPAVCSADGQLSHRPRPRSGLPGPVLGVAFIKCHPGSPQPLLCL